MGTAGCAVFSGETERLSLERLRVVNLYTEQIRVSVNITNDIRDMNYSNTVNPISEGKSEEWVVKPDDIAKSLEYTYTLEVENGNAATITSQALEDMFNEVSDGCLELSWLIRDSSNDIGMFLQTEDVC